MGVVATCILPKSHRGLSPGVLSNNSKALAIEKDARLAQIYQPHKITSFLGRAMAFSTLMTSSILASDHSELCNGVQAFQTPCRLAVVG